MSDTFRVGEIAAIYAPGSLYHDTDVTVIEGLHWLDPVDAFGRRVGPSYEGYTVECGAHPYPARGLGRGWAVRPENLRKRRPPQDPAYLKFREWVERQEYVIGRALAPASGVFTP